AATRWRSGWSTRRTHGPAGSRPRTPVRVAQSLGVLGHDAEARGRLTPHLLEVRADRLNALVAQLVDAPRAVRLVGHEPGLLQQPQVPGDRRPADRKLVGDLLNRAPAVAEDLHDRAPVGIPERIEGAPM